MGYTVFRYGWKKTKTMKSRFYDNPKKKRKSKKPNWKGKREEAKMKFERKICLSIQCLFIQAYAKRLTLWTIWLNSCHSKSCCVLESNALFARYLYLVIRSIYTLRHFAQFTFIVNETEKKNPCFFIHLFLRLFNGIECTAKKKVLLIQIKQ